MRAFTTEHHPEYVRSTITNVCDTFIVRLLSLVIVLYAIVLITCVSWKWLILRVSTERRDDGAGDDMMPTYC
jgi:hypothetical protein